MMRRILALLSGAAILALVAMMTVGTVLAAPIGMWVAAKIQRARGRCFTRRAGWIGAVSACALLMAGLIGFAMTRMPSDFMATVQQQAAQREQEREPSAVEQALRRVSNANVSQAAMERKTRELAHSKAFLWWTMIVGGALGAGLGGLLLGSVGWAGSTLVLFGATGRGPVTTVQ